jgi:hypothetical protein
MVTETELSVVGKGIYRMREAFRNPCVTPRNNFQYQLDKVDALQDDEAPDPFISTLHSLS